MAVDPNLIQQVADALARVPDGAWGFMAGAVVTITTTIIGNRHSRKQQKTQLDHATSEGQKQRLVEMRKNVYLPAAEELVKANTFIGSLTSVDLTKVDIGEKLSGFFAAMIKLQIVGAPETARAANNLASSYGEVLHECLVTAVPIRNAVTELEAWDIQYNANLSEVERLGAAMKQYNESGANEPEKFHTLDQSSQWHQNELATIEEKRIALRADRLELTSAFARRIPDHITTLLTEHSKLLVRIRAELDVDGSSAFLEDMLKAQQARIAASTERTINAINEQAKG